MAGTTLPLIDGGIGVQDGKPSVERLLLSPQTLEPTRTFRKEALC
jgi:hypothetical protein